MNLDLIKDRLNDNQQKIFSKDLELGLESSRMSLKVNEHVLNLMNWKDPYNCPVRKMYLPLESEYEKPHPLSFDDSLNEKYLRVNEGKFDKSLMVHQL